MAVSAFWLKWGLRFYPPLFFQRIWVIQLAKNFSSVQVRINKSLLNRNYNNTIFGGTIFSATDPFYPVMLHQLITKKGYKVIVWSKSAEVHFIKPGNSNLYFEIKITDNIIADAEHILDTEGKYVRSFTLEIVNKDGEVCVTVNNEVYIRNLNFTDHDPKNV